MREYIEEEEGLQAPLEVQTRRRRKMNTGDTKDTEEDFRLDGRDNSRPSCQNFPFPTIFCSSPWLFEFFVPSAFLFFVLHLTHFPDIV